MRASANGERTAPKDPDRTRRYNREKERLLLVSLTLGWLTGAVILLTRLPVRIRNRSFDIAGAGFSGNSLTAITFGLLSWVISLPLSYYSGYIHEHRYGLSNQTRRDWTKDHLKGLGLSLAFQVPVTNAVLAIIARWPRRWWLVMTGISIPFTVLLAQLVPVLIMPLFNRFEPLRNRELAERLKTLAARSGIQVAEVLEMDMSKQTRKANAFFAGLGRTKRIVLADTLLENFSPEEIEIVVAHEIAHQAHRDLWRFIALGSAFTAALSFVVNVLAGKAIRRYPKQIGVRNLADVAAMPLLGWLLSMTSLLLMPIQNAYSRQIERRADDYALRLTQEPARFVSAMERLGEMNLSDPNPPLIVRYALYSHPPIRERQEQARAFARDNGLPVPGPDAA